MSCARCGAECVVGVDAGAARAHSPYREPAAERDAPAESAPTPPLTSKRPPAEDGLIPAALGTCPRCAAVALSEHHDQNVCPRCGGMFVPHRRLQQIVHEHRASGVRPVLEPDEPSHAGAAALVAYLRCPECTAFMSRKNFGGQSGVLVDVCKLHGVWFDRGELDAVAAFAFDLPADAASRAALLALMGRQSPRPARSAPPPPLAMPLLSPYPNQPLLLGAESVAELVTWIGRWFS